MRRSESAENHVMKLDDTQRVKVLSPGRLVAKRFLRNRLAIIGSVILILMFLFAFVSPLFYPYGQTEIFYKYDDLIVNYAQATERLDYTSYSVNEDIEIHYSVKNKMTSYIKQLEEAGGDSLDITGDDGRNYTIVRLGDNVYTLNTAVGSEIAVFSGMDSAATYNSRIKLFTMSLPVSEDFENAFAEAVSAGETSFEAGGKTYFITSELRNTYEALDLTTGTMSFNGEDLSGGFTEAFLQGIMTGSFTYDGMTYAITGDAAQGFTISESGRMTTALVCSRYVFDAVDTSTVFSEEFKKNAFLALYGDKKFAAGCSRDVIAQGAALLGWDLDKLLDMTLRAMQDSEAKVEAEAAAL
jgi:peptide/nickel transport system permease protein